MLAPGQYRAFEIVGDSMLPTPSGSIIVGEKVEDINDVKNNFTYIVVSRNEGIVYKRVMKNNRSKNKYTLVSDNPTYQPYQVNGEDILEVWKASHDPWQGQCPTALECKPTGQCSKYITGAGKLFKEEDQLSSTS